jgi:glycosyltransferase involved in cell wall biosynthesis
MLLSNQCILAPNSHWMTEELEKLFGDLAQVRQVNFGIDNKWFEVSHTVPGDVNHWLCILRVTEKKIGPLFEWGEKIFSEDQQLHLFGPNQQGLDVPKWVNYHGPASPDQLIKEWYPKSIGFVTLSQHSEGKPQVLLETLAAGMPVIASSIPAHEETVENNVTGILVSSESEFRNAVDRLQDPLFNLQASRQARSSSLREFGTWDDCIQRYRKLYESLM